MKWTYFRHSALVVFVKMETHSQFLNILVLGKQETNTQQDINMYCSNHLMKEILLNLY